MSEAKKERFRNTAKVRVQRVLRHLHSLEALAKPGTYEWTEEDVAFIQEAITAGLARFLARMEQAKSEPPSFDW